MRSVLLLIAIVVVAACSTTPKRVHCDRHLVPINPASGQATPPRSSP